VKKEGGTRYLNREKAVSRIKSKREKGGARFLIDLKAVFRIKSKREKGRRKPPSKSGEGGIQDKIET